MRAALIGIALGCSLVGCRIASSDPASLGYGDPNSPSTADGYVHERGAPFDRPKPTAWALADQPMLGAATEVGRAPPPVEPSADIVEFCAHFLGVLATATTPPSDAAVVERVCQAQTRTEKLARSEDRWQAYRGCILAAGDLEQATRCDEAHPSSLAEGVVASPEFAACQHLIMTSLFEELGSDASVPAEQLAPFGPIVRECVDTLIESERATRTPEEYTRMLECVLAQADTAAMEACVSSP